jgi:hypothetical protein
VRRQTVILALLASVVFATTAGYLRWLERRAATPALDDQFAAGRLRPVAEVARKIKAMKLVTVEVETRATSEQAHESWRGDVHASVRAPVRLLFGTDLSRVDSVTFGPLAGEYRVRVPRPERIATEVDGGQEESRVSVGWLRLRSRAGEYWLGRARTGLYEEARRLMLSPDDAAEVRETTRRQVADLVRRLVGPARVTVVFDDE